MKMLASKCKILTERDHQLLALADFYGYKALAVSVKSDAVSSSGWWSYNKKKPFICGEPDPASRRKGLIKGEPAIFEIARKMGYGEDRNLKMAIPVLRKNRMLSRVSYEKKDGKWYVVGAREFLINEAFSDLELVNLGTMDFVALHKTNLNIVLHCVRNFEAAMQTLRGKPFKMEKLPSKRYLERCGLDSYDKFQHVVLNSFAHLGSMSAGLKINSVSSIEAAIERLDKKIVYDKFSV